MKSKQDLIERKYSRRINRLLKKMKDNTMEELWVELDKLKEDLERELTGCETN